MSKKEKIKNTKKVRTPKVKNAKTPEQIEKRNTIISRIILIIFIIAIIALIAYICYGATKEVKNPIATIDVEYVDNDGNTQTGTMKIELYPDQAPITVANFVNLANNGFYNNLTFHRIISDFMIQGGDKKGDGTGSASYSDLNKKIQAGSDKDYTYSIKGEFSSNGVQNKIKFEKGVIAMARSDYRSYNMTTEGYNSASTQFFIVTSDEDSVRSSLSGQYAPFGKLIDGYDVLDKLANVKIKQKQTDSSQSSSSSSESSTPENPPVIKNLTVDTFGVKYKIPDVINYDKIQQKLQYNQQQMQQNQSSSSSGGTSIDSSALQTDGTQATGDGSTEGTTGETTETTGDATTGTTDATSDGAQTEGTTTQGK